MTTLDRYLAAQLAGGIIKALVTFVGLFILVDLLANLRATIAAHQVPWSIVAEYYLYFSPRIAFQAAPLAVLIATLLVLGRASERNEITAILAGGVSLYRLCAAPVGVALAFACLNFGLEQTLGAPAIDRADRMERVYFGRLPANPREGQSWANLSGGWTCHVMKYNRLADTAEGVTFHAIREDHVEQVRADRMFWDEAREQWLLEDGRWVVFDAEVDAILRDERITQRTAPIEEAPEDLFVMARPPDTKNVFELRADIERAGRRGMPMTPMWVDYHAKFAQPFLSFVMVWLAIPFALRLRRGGLAIGFGASIAIAILYIIVQTISMGFGYVGQWHPAAAAWLPNILFLAIGLALFWRTPT